jgi:hypothetical protein
MRTATSPRRSARGIGATIRITRHASARPRTPIGGVVRAHGSAIATRTSMRMNDMSPAREHVRVRENVDFLASCGRVPSRILNVRRPGPHRVALQRDA